MSTAAANGTAPIGITPHQARRTGSDSLSRERPHSVRSGVSFQTPVATTAAARSASPPPPHPTWAQRAAAAAGASGHAH
ncbi:LOW QUALITY PROTEIN: hypothetical protein AMAG_19112 [Allomyces macrogynus ATCC 38327]|uniref:Uncharacterized protein n=1 Tax=Allomyces macrogynus (strain ATCC 38327) TaxID=578462 RepID=A0A0L0SNR4_ALLM3|nr:LOW QUALITY PROTEIN: hypothetical protein AMAG_19112 [Allomyces macrogynus ATCC 38327]|eukprot:KNE64137.1 LOW QUALITY PROTEIN: hypothetical protein AMAG_19112 [Allomyces macrogynus ATCC 38327]